MFWPCETRTSICRNLATISSGLYRFLAITVLLDVKDIPQVGPLQWGWIIRFLAIRVLLVEIGALSVGWIVQTNPLDKPFQRGQEKSVFRFGGSAIVVFSKRGGFA